ncbi:MAG: beta-propeller fold lactonase family protein, partial [Verrucomicrobiota bacterium]
MNLLPTVYGLALSLPLLIHGAEPFHVYAPSRTGEQLWVVRAQPLPDGSQVALTVQSQVPIGFPAAIITQHPEQPLLYLSGITGDPGEVPGALCYLDEDSGQVERIERVKLQHGVCYLSVDRSHRFLLGVSYRGGQADVYQLKEPDFRPRWVFARETLPKW